MRILIITHAAGTPDIGPNMRTYFLGRNLVARGHDVHIVGSGEFHKYKNSPLQGGKYTNANIAGIEYHWLPTFRYKKRNYQQVINQIDFVFKLWLYRKKWMLLNPDVVIVSSPPPFGIFIGKSITKRCKSKLIFEIRDLWPEIICELGSFSKHHPYIKLVEWAVKVAYNVADGIVSVKPGDLKYIEEQYKVNGKTQYIPNGYDHIHVKDEPFNHPVFDNSSFKVIYTGALSNYYALEHLLVAAQKLQQLPLDISIIIVGDGNDRKKYEKIKTDHQISNVYFLGFLPKKNMLSILRQSDVAFLGLKDTKVNRFGISTNKLYEYMFAKTPIIASYKTDYDLVKESGCGFSVTPESGDAVYKAILNMYNLSGQERKALGEKGYDFLMNNHTFEKITDIYTDFIQSI